MKTGDGDPTEGLMTGILKYLEKSPTARDTPRGVAQEWLKGQPGSYCIADVKKALDRLARNKLVRRWKRGKTELYGAME